MGGITLLLNLGQLTYDSNGNPDPLPTPLERATSLFNALDRNAVGTLSKQEFLEAYTQRYRVFIKYYVFFKNFQYMQPLPRKDC